MGKECEIKKYIDVLPVSKEEKEFINEKHNKVFNELKASKKFRFVDGVLQAFKENYVESLNEVAAINAKYGKVAAIVDTTKAKRVVQINTISLGKNYVDVKEARGLQEQDAERAGVEYTDDYLFDENKEEITDNNVINPNYLLLTNKEQKQFNDLQKEGLINQGLFDKNKNIIYSTDKLEQLLTKIKELAINWIKIEKLSSWNKVTIDVTNEENTKMSKKLDAAKTEKELLDRIKSIVDRLGLKVERLDAIYNKQQEINTLTKQLDLFKTEKEKQEILGKIENLKKFGVKKEALALADTLNGVIQLTTEDNITMFSEEVIHFLVDIVEQKNPTLFKELMKKVSTSEVYKNIKPRYEAQENYDENQVKKEAIAQIIVNVLTNNTEENEYQNEKAVNKFWETIKNWASGFFNSISNKDYDAFDKFIREVVNSDYIELEDRKFLGDKYYYFLASTREEIRDSILSEKDNVSKKIVGEKEKYFYRGNLVPERVSDLVEKLIDKMFKDSTWRKNNKNSFALERGSIIHKAFENTFKKYINEKTGEVLETPIESNTELKAYETQYPEHAKKISGYIQTVINAYPNAYFLTEVFIINKKKTLGGTIDLLILDKDGKVHLFDWKSIKSQKYVKQLGGWEDITDIPWWKKKTWLFQIDTYTKILSENYNIKLSQFGKMRAIPILTKEGESTILDINFSPFEKKKINLKERASIPIVSDKEFTGKKAIDSLLSHLRFVKEDIQKKIDNKQGKKTILLEDLNYISNLITDLIVAEDLSSLFLNISGLLSKTSNFLKDKVTIRPTILISDSTLDSKDEVFNEFLDSLKNKSKEELGDLLLEIENQKKQLLLYVVSAGQTSGTASLLLQVRSIINSDNDQINSIINDQISKLDTSLHNGISNLQFLKDNVIREFGARYGVLDVDAFDKEAGIIGKVTDLISTVYHQRTKVGKLIGEIFRKIDYEIREKDKKTSENFENLRKKKLSIIETNVKKTFENLLKEGEVLIDGVKHKVFKLIPKINGEYYKEHNEILEKYKVGLNSNLRFWSSKEYTEITKWIEGNINTEKWKEYYEEKKKEYEIYIKDLALKTDTDFPNQFILEKMKNFEINNDIFKSPRAFSKLSSTRFINEDKWESDEYKIIKNNPVDLEIYDYFKKLNQKAISLGYLDNFGESTFIPFEIRNTDITKSPLNYLNKYLFNKFQDDSINDFQSLNPLTGEDELTLKRPYTDPSVINKTVSQQLDLFKVFEQFEQALNQYEELKNAENLLQTITELEKEKEKELKTDIFGRIIGEKQREDTDYQRLKKLVNKRLYNKKYDTDKVAKSGLSLLKTKNFLDSYASQLFLGFYHKVAVGAFIGSAGVAVSKNTKAYKSKDFLISLINPLESSLLKDVKTIKKAFNYRITSLEKEEVNLRRSNTFKNLAIHGWKFAANTLQIVDEKIQDDLFFASMRSHYVINNKIVNKEDIRDELFPNYFDNPSENEKKLESHLKDKKLLIGWVKENIKNNKLDLSSLDKTSVFDFNSLVTGTVKEIIGNMSEDDYSMMRIGLFSNLASKFKVWLPGVAKSFYSNLHYNRETKTSSVGSTNAYFSIFYSVVSNFYKSKNLSKKEAFKLGMTTLFPYLPNNLTKTKRNYLKIAYKEYVEEAKEYGYDIEISENQFINTYLTKSQSFTNHLMIVAFLLFIQGVLSGDDDDSFLEEKLEEGIEKGLQELESLFVPYEAVKFITKISIPTVGAIGVMLNPLSTLIYESLYLDYAKLHLYKLFNLDTTNVEKDVYEEISAPKQVLRETLDAIPYVRQINRNIIIPNSEEWQNYLGVDKNYKVK